MSDNIFAGSWAYRSFYNDPDLTITDLSALELGQGTIVFSDAASGVVAGTIGGPGWTLNLHGSATYGFPSQVWFQGTGIVGGEEWIYAYVGWMVPVWPNSTDTLQRAAFVGSVTRVIAHSNGSGGTSPAGVVGSFYACRAD